jgi:hypothetical protein
MRSMRLHEACFSRRVCCLCVLVRDLTHHRFVPNLLQIWKVRCDSACRHMLSRDGHQAAGGTLKSRVPTVCLLPVQACHILSRDGHQAAGGTRKSRVPTVCLLPVQACQSPTVILLPVQACQSPTVCLLPVQACQRPRPTRGTMACLRGTLLHASLTLGGVFSAARSGKSTAEANAWLHKHVQGALVVCVPQLTRSLGDQYRRSDPDVQQVGFLGFCVTCHVGPWWLV